MLRIYDSCYRTGGDQDLVTGVAVVSAGHFYANDHRVDDRTREDLLILFVIGGSGTISIGDRRWNLVAGDLAVLPPGLVHTYQSDPDRGWEIWWSHFHGPLAVQALAMAGFNAARPVLNLGVHADLIASFRELLDLLRVQEAIGCLDLTAAFLRLCALTVRLSRRHADHDRLAAAVAGNPGDLAEMAAVVDMSPAHFSRRFHRAYGVTPWRFITTRRIRKAMELLSTSDLPIKQVAHAVGFPDPDYFSRAFRRETGVNPRRFRQAEGR